MGYFPFFIDLEGRSGIVFGGGTVALRKVEKLLPYGPRLTVCAPGIREEFKSIEGVCLLYERFSPSLLEDVFFAVTATGDHALDRRIAGICRERRILVNAVDDRDACTFLFPSLIQQGPLSIGISTGGSSPTAAIRLKEQFASALPENIGSILSWLDSMRSDVRAAFAGEQTRARLFSRLYDACVQAGRPLNGAEYDAILNRFLQEDTI